MEPPGDSRLRWMCRRGTRELELVLRGYVEAFVAGSPDAQARHELFDLLSLDDGDLVAGLKGEWKPCEPALDAALEQVRHHIERGDPTVRMPVW